MSETLTKKAFAEKMGVSPGRLSQWLADGKIDNAALDGEGRHARIIVDVAQKQLAERLDPSQRFGLNGLKASRPEPQGAPDTSDQDDLPTTAEQQIVEQRLRQAELNTRKMAREDALASGRYMRTDEARRMLGESNSRMLQAFEGSLADMAQDVAAKFGIPARDVRHVLRQSFRVARARNARLFDQVADKTSPTVEDVIAEPEARGSA